MQIPFLQIDAAAAAAAADDDQAVESTNQERAPEVDGLRAVADAEPMLHHMAQQTDCTGLAPKSHVPSSISAHCISWQCDKGRRSSCPNTSSDRLCESFQAPH